MNGRIVLSIPIDLDSRQDIATALASKYGTDYVFIGRVFRSTIADESCEIDICPLEKEIKELPPEASDRNYKQTLRNKFEFAGHLDEITLQQLDRSRQLIYLTSAEVGYQACLQIARLTQVLLQIGGIAVKLESADVAHSRDRWLSNYNSDDVFDIYSLYVALVEGEEYYYSCGMHHFGKADVAIATGTPYEVQALKDLLRGTRSVIALTEDIGLAIYVMNVFNYYRLTESPILQDGHTFRPDIECPQYVLKWITDYEHTADSDCYNPHGRWLLTLNIARQLRP